MKIPILMYHSISSPGDNDLRPPGYWLSPSAFEQHLLLFQDKGFIPISLLDFYRGRRGELPLPEKSVVLTFDDGYLNNYLRVLPRLLHFGYRAIFFVTVSTLGQAGMMGIREVEKLLQAGMEIGSHGMTHDLLRVKNQEELLHQLEESKRFLRAALRTEIAFFSLPRGYLPSRLPSLAEEAGYLGMCTSQPGYNSLRTDPFRWRRFPIRSGFGSEHLQAILRKRGWLLRRIYLREKLKAWLRFRYRWKVLPGKVFYSAAGRIVNKPELNPLPGLSPTSIRKF